MKVKIILIFIFLNFTYVYGNEILDVNKIYKNLRCLVCQGQSVADSNSDFAQTLKLVVKDLVVQGKNENEIYDFLSEKYGDWILYKPKFNYKNSFLWAIPYIVLAIGGLIIVYLIKKRSKKA